MRTIGEVLDQFAYHPATPQTAATHNELREAYSEHATAIWSLIPDGPEKTLAMRKLQESLMYANLAVALTAPTDVDHAHVARVLPGNGIGLSCGDKSPHEGHTHNEGDGRSDWCPGVDAP